MSPERRIWTCLKCGEVISRFIYESSDIAQMQLAKHEHSTSCKQDDPRVPII